MIQAGKLNKGISILAQTTTRDADSGEKLQTWTSIRDCWAEIAADIKSKTNETLNNGRFTSQLRVIISFRYSKTITVGPENRIQHVSGDGRTHTYEIEAVSNTGQRNEEIVCLCHEIDAKE